MGIRKKIAAAWIGLMTAFNSAQAGLVPVRPFLLTIDATEIGEEWIIKLAGAVAPIEVEVLRNELVANAIHRNCAGVGTKYINLAQEKMADLNGHIGVDVFSAQSEPKKVSIPFCPTMQYTALLIEKRDTVLTVFRRSITSETSEPGDVIWKARQDWRQRVIDANHPALGSMLDLPEFAKLRSASREKNWLNDTQSVRDKALNTLLQASIGKTIIVPAGTMSRIHVYVSVTNFEAYLDALRSSKITETPGNTGKLVVHDGLGCIPTEGTETTSREIPKITTERILRILKINEIARRSVDRAPTPKSPTIFVADTGFIQRTVSGMEFRDVIHSKLTTPANEQYRYFRHGTQVATVAMGGPEFMFVNYFLNPKMIVKMFNVMDGAVVGLAETQAAIQDAENSKVDIVNLSFEFVNKLTTLETHTKNDSRLFVVAAGNSYAELKGSSAWPALHGGRWDNSVVTQ